MNVKSKESTNAVPTQTGNLLQPAATQNILPEVIKSVLGDTAGATLNNFDGDTNNRWRLRSLACGPDCIGFDPENNTPFAIKYWYAHRVEVVDPRSGQITNATRCVLIDANDVARCFVSSGIAKDLADIIGMFGIGPYSPPLRVRVRQIKTRSGFRMYTIVPE